MFRQKLYSLIFENKDKASKKFEIILLWVILSSVIVVILESTPNLSKSFSGLLHTAEWVFTIAFTIEFIVRIWASPRPWNYLLSFWGIIDFLSILPTYLSLFYFGYHYLLVVRIFRLFRIFRILKLARFNKEAQVLAVSIRSSMYKISIFLMAVTLIVVIMGTIMYVIEGGQEGFTSIPQSIYWAIVTVTTVGYGDMVPQTTLGKIVSSIVMIIGYAIIAVPTGIITVGLAQSSREFKVCNSCESKNEVFSNYCNHCGKQFKE